MATVLDQVGTSLTQGALLGMAVQATHYSCRRRSGRRILKYLPGRGAERDGAGGRARHLLARPLHGGPPALGLPLPSQEMVRTLALEAGRAQPSPVLTSQHAL